MGARRWQQAPPKARPRMRRFERAVLGPAVWLVVVVLDRRLRKALARAH